MRRSSIQTYQLPTLQLTYIAQNHLRKFFTENGSKTTGPKNGGGKLFWGVNIALLGDKTTLIADCQGQLDWK